MERLILEARDVWKRYPGVQALAGVDLRVRAGSVHCLVGENGSGKSTLTKIIAGVVAPDQGEVHIGDRARTPTTPRDSIDAGVRVIYQDLALFPNLSVAENLAFNGSGALHQRMPWSRARDDARTALAEVGLDIDPRTMVEQLPVAERQRVAIARAVSSEGRIVLMDEPTAALTHGEIERLLALVHQLRSRGLSFVFISHKLREVMDVADDITVLRNGEVVAADRADTFDVSRITRLMTGSELEATSHDVVPTPEAPPVMTARGLALDGVFDGVDLDLHAGRVLGIAGLLGSGRTQIGLALVGLVSPSAGEIRLDGEPVRDPLRHAAIQYVPEDRLEQGLLLDWSITDNLVIQHLDAVVGSRGFLDPDRKRELAETWRERLSIKTPDVGAALTTLSGGNQQRVLLARALAPSPRVLVVNNPTVGVDVGSRADLHERLRQVAADGTAVLVLSDEIPELLDTCDEVVVVRDGRITSRHARPDLDDDRLWSLVAGDQDAA